MADIHITIGGTCGIGKTTLVHMIKHSLRSYGVDVVILGNDEHHQDFTSDELAPRLIALGGKTVQILEVQMKRKEKSNLR